MPYDYTARDLLTGPPFHYMFSPYQGLPFLKDYVGARRTDLIRLGASGSGPLPEAPGAPSHDLPDFRAGGFDTEPVLAALVAAARGGTIHLAWIDMFLRKFEAAKRLRRSYSQHLKITDPAPVDRLAYARLAFLASAALAGPRDLRRLNALLKLNDIVLGAPHLDPEALALVSRAVARELACVHAVARERALALPEDEAC